MPNRPNGHREKMRVIGKEDLLEPLNRAALQIARKVADGKPGNLMAGNISNTNIWDPARQSEVRGMFEEMVGWAVEEGADLIIGETFYYAGESPHGRTFPTALDPLSCNRYEIGAFAKEAHGLGINYLGVCCGASPMLVREVAEAVGRETEASRYSEKMQNHFMYGDNERLPEHIRALGETA